MADTLDNEVLLRMAAALAVVRAENETLGCLAAELLEEISVRTGGELDTAPTAANVATAKLALAWLAREREALVATLDKERTATADEITQEWCAARAAASAAGFDVTAQSASDVITTLAMALSLARSDGRQPRLLN